jgi:hypothetical protein
VRSPFDTGFAPLAFTFGFNFNFSMTFLFLSFFRGGEGGSTGSSHAKTSRKEEKIMGIVEKYSLCKKKMY